MDEFQETAKALTIDTDRDGITDIYGFCVAPSWNRWPIIAQQNNISFMNLREEADRLAEVLEVIRRMAFRDRSLLVYPKEIKGFGPFYYGKAAMTLTTNVELGVWRAGGMPFQAKIAQLPFGPVRARKIGAIYGMVPKGGDCRLAMDMLRIAISDETQGQLVRSGMYLSVRRNINEGVWDHDDMKMIQEEELLGDRSYFIQELFPNREMIAKLEADMELFWSGVEAVGPLIERLKKTFPQADRVPPA
jgi:ABC-type glycerol-3-phosphate transport system substrate-binding protein